MSISIPVIYNIKKKINKNTEIEIYIHSTLFLSFQILAAAYPKVRTIEFVFGFGNAKNLLLLLKSYLSEFDILNFSAIFFGVVFRALNICRCGVSVWCFAFQLYFSEVFRALMQIRGPCAKDLFADRRNAQLPQFFSWRPDPKAIASDALQQDWSHEKNYAFPPFCLIMRSL